MKENSVFSVDKIRNQLLCDHDLISEFPHVMEVEIFGRFIIFEKKLLTYSTGSIESMLTLYKLYITQLFIADLPFLYIPATISGKFWLIVPYRERRKFEYIVSKAYKRLPKCDVFL